MVPDRNPMRSRDRLKPEEAVCDCTHLTDSTDQQWRVGGKDDGTVRVTVGPVTILDVDWRTAMDLAGAIADAAFRSAVAAGEPYMEAFETLWRSTFRPAIQEVPADE